MRFAVRSSFPATHRIRIDSRGTLEPLHAHNWRVEAWLSAPSSEVGLPAAAQRFLAAWVARYEGKCFNDVAPFDTVNPTAEEVARVLATDMDSAFETARVVRVDVGEAAGFSASYRPRRQTPFTGCS